MLRLDKLELRGFKSFCDTTQVIFHEGVTAIVGPNGCGKSNIVDAITWVLGEQSAKHLRGGKMEDVIFNGTRHRKPLGMAEVSLTLTAVQDVPDGCAGGALDDDPTSALAAANAAANPVASGEPSSDADGPPPRRRAPRLPQLLAGEKITIGRRLYRSGDSDYLINGRICRLRDIQDFFSGTGLSRAHYAIIEQGRIGQILSSKPHERRALIEEAAGIGRFKAKRHQAELKLEATRQNLARLDDLIGEIERTIANLKRQAQKSRKFISLREELRAAQRRYLALRRMQLQTARTCATETCAELTAACRQLSVELVRLTEAVAAAREATRQTEAHLATAQQSAAAAEIELDRLRHAGANLEAERRRIDERDAELAAALEQIRQRCQLVDQALGEARATNARLATELAAQESALATAEADHRTLGQQLREAEAASEEARHRHLAHLTRAERLRHQAEQLAETNTRLVRQAHALTQEQRRATERQADVQTECAAAEQRLADLEQRLAVVKADFATAQAALAAADAARKLAQERLSEARRAYHRAEDRHQALQDLDRHHAHYAATVRALLDRAAEIGGFHPLGTLADFLTVTEGYEALVEHVLGDVLQAVVVATLPAAQSAATWLTRTQTGRATLLVAGVQGGSAGTSVPQPVPQPTRLWDVLGVSEQVATAFRQAFPELADALLAPSLEAAVEAAARTPGRCVVTATGEQVFGGVRLTAGGGEAKSILRVKRDIRALQAELRALAHTIADLTREQAQAETRWAAVQSAYAALDAELRRLETERAAQTVEVGQRRREVERAHQHLSVIAAEQRQLATETEQLASRRAKLEAELTEALAEREAAEQVVLAEQQRLTTLRPAVEAAAQTLAERRAQAAGLLERRRAAEAELRRLEREWRDLEQGQARLTLERTALQARCAETQHRLADLVTQKAAAATALAEARQAVAAATAELVRCRQDLERLEAALQRAQAMDRDRRDRLAAAEVEVARLTAELGYLDRHCQAELNCALESLPPPTDEGLSETALEATIAALKEALVALGAVNMLALDELAEAEKRLEFLTAQRADVLASLATTEETLKEIHRRTRRRFREAFDHINAYFGEIFQELFGGGRGEMLLIEPDDPLESGIEIVAQPPGKRLQSVLLLSGGEKAMAALALILAIFRYRPSPFCVLDEVDAPLDEANIDRFTDKVRAMSRQTQFLIVTHNKRTMEAADSIYGVTMPETGVSKLLSVRFDDKPSAVTQAISSAAGSDSVNGTASTGLGVSG